MPGRSSVIYRRPASSAACFGSSMASMCVSTVVGEDQSSSRPCMSGEASWPPSAVLNGRSRAVAYKNGREVHHLPPVVLFSHGDGGIRSLQLVEQDDDAARDRQEHRCRKHPPERRLLADRALRAEVDRDDANAV